MTAQLVPAACVLVTVPLEEAAAVALSLAIGNSRMSADGYTPAPSCWELRDALVQASRSSADGSAEVPHRRVAEVAPVPTTAPGPASRRELAVAAVAELAGVRPTYVRRLARRGVLTGRKTTSGWLLDEDEARAWAAGRRRDESDRVAG